MPSPDHHPLSQHSAAALGLRIALLLAVCGSISVAAAQTGATEQRQKLEHLRDVNADARRDADELRRQMDELQAEATDYGLLLTLEEKVFATNGVGLSSTGRHRIDALALFLEQHTQRTVAVDGYAGVGGYRYDQALSKRRADAVKAYLVQRGIASRRLTGRGNNQELQDYGSASHQQPKRRVEVLIIDPLTSVPPPDATTPET